MTSFSDALTPTVYRGIAVALISVALLTVLLDRSGGLAFAIASLVSAALSLRKDGATESHAGFHLSDA